MKIKIPQLLLASFIFYFIVDPLRMILLKGGAANVGLNIDSVTAYFMLTTFFSFFVYSLFAYLGFLYFFKSRKWHYITFILIIGFASGAFFRFMLQQKISKWLVNAINYNEGISIEFFMRDQFYYAIMYFTVGIVFFVFQYGIYKDKRESDLLMINQKMELNLLRSQINPHFLLNSMNNIYSLVSMNSEKALPAIDTLSNILKYTLYENREVVNLTEEKDYINNYIDLQSLRFAYKPAIQVDFEETTLTAKVPQFILVPLIENAFKHGDLKNEASPLVIKSEKINNKLRLHISNLKGNHEKDKHGGIGLENVKKRLALIYGEKHTFEISEDESNFSIEISIPLS